ncbi:MAG: cold shock domain-containing protein [Candidatus Liptonbacteria bacterium]|nr:cold shock domain-containing protein [Candidatus Liptonbacteria bacterium]
MKGIVEMFVNGKLYGRLLGEDGNLYHVGLSAIQPHGTGFKSLDVGEEVEFTPVNSGFRHQLPDAKKVLRSVQFPVLPENLESSVDPMDVVHLKVDALGRVYLPKVEKDPRDYASGVVRAFYVGDPGYISDKTEIDVELPESAKDGVVLVPVNDDGGILKRDIAGVQNFPWGGFVIVVRIEGKSCLAITKKIFVRTQDSRSVSERRDHGVWVGVQDSYRLELTIPDNYVDERDLMSKLEPQIPDPYGWAKKKPAASARKFARGIARAIVGS